MAKASILHNLLTSNFKIQETDINLKKVRLINFILLLATPINTLFIFANYASNQYLFAAFNIAIVIVMSFSFFFLRRSISHLQIAAHGALLGMFISHVAALLQGGIANSGFVWFFLFPLFAIFLTGRHVGRIWLAVLFFTIALTFALQNVLTLPYEPIYLVFILIALILESFYVLFQQAIQLRYESELDSKNSELHKLTDDLKQSNHELTYLTDNLQKEVTEQVSIVRSRDNLLNQQSKMASLGEMMSFISHQWKQPIAIISTTALSAQLAKELEVDDLAEQYTEAFIQIIEQTKLMHSTMKDFLNFARPNKNENFTIVHALTILEQLISANFLYSNITLKLSQEDSSLMLYGKENEFVHAVMNIANNTKDALENQTRKDGELYIHIKKQGDRIIITMNDNAGGISNDIIDHVFEAYTSTKLDKGGTGLGLHMSHKIITKHMNGLLTVSNEDKGARFTLNFPAVNTL